MALLSVFVFALAAPLGTVATEGAAPDAVATEPGRTRANVDWTVPLLHTGGLFVGMRATEAYLWPDPFAETDPDLIFEHYREAYTRPPIFDLDQRAFEWDGDHWTLNVIGHGLLGSELYFRPRRCGASVLGALAFAAGSSLFWEYVVEANGVRPSALDLAYTPLAGIVLGEARYAGYTAAGAIENRTFRGLVRAVLDPFGELERALGTPC